MRIGTIRGAVVLAGLLLALPASADVTITGTVGEIGVMSSGNFNGVFWPFRFKMTDATQTATCVDPGNGVGAKYAYFYGGAVGNNQNGDAQYREWYAALLVSKKGAPISCTIKTNQDCHVTSCTLP